MNLKILLSGTILGAGLLFSSTNAQSPGFSGVEGDSTAVESNIPIPTPNPRRAQALEASSRRTAHPMPSAGQIRPGEFPQEVDLRIRFNQKVVESFTDHILLRDNSQNLIKDMMFHIQEGKLRLSTVIDFAKLDQAITANNMSDYLPADYPQRVARNEVFCLAVDVEFDLSTMQGRENALYLTWKRAKMNFFGFWVGSREETAFKAYLRRNPVGREEAQGRDLQALQSTVDRLENKANRTEAEDRQLMEALLALRKAQTLEIARVPINPGEEPIKLILNEVVKAIGTEKIARTGLAIRYSYDDGATTHIIEASGLNGLFQTHLPEFSIVHVATDKTFMVFSGRLQQ